MRSCPSQIHRRCTTALPVTTKLIEMMYFYIEVDIFTIYFVAIQAAVGGIKAFTAAAGLQSSRPSMTISFLEPWNRTTPKTGSGIPQRSSVTGNVTENGYFLW